MQLSDHGDHVFLSANFLFLYFFGPSRVAAKQTKLCIPGFLVVTSPRKLCERYFLSKISLVLVGVAEWRSG